LASAAATGSNPAHHFDGTRLGIPVRHTGSEIYPDTTVESIYHLAVCADWSEVVESGAPYSRSTLGKSLTEEGFIHCSFASQVGTIADVVYRGRSDLMLLIIDPSLVPVEIRLENAEGDDDLFPHVYGELPLAAVVRAESVTPKDDGTFDLRELL
jgi:uncharacterized protein (DUF952 family)